LKWIIARSPTTRSIKVYLESPRVRNAGPSGRRRWVVLPKFAYKFDDEEEAKKAALLWCGHVEPYEESEEGA
jgi:hypothetical protein